MRRPVIDNVEIVEPPLEELTKKRSGLKGACFTGCLFFILLFVALFVFIRVYSGPGPKTYSRVPENFPKDIPVYDPDNIEQVTYISGKYKSRNVELAALGPKIILSPLLIALNKDVNGMDATTTRWQSFKNFVNIVLTPVGNHSNTFQVAWRGMDADMRFVFNYYSNELKKKGFTIEEESDTATVKKFNFKRTDGVDGSLLIQGDEENRPGVDYALLTVNFPDEAVGTVISQPVPIATTTLVE